MLNSTLVYEWLSGFINPERGLVKLDFSLDTMKTLAELAGHPEKCAPSIHIAGSKGKGSVTGMIAAILETSEISAARYASPHVSDFRERISGGSGFFCEETYALAGKELRELVEGCAFEQGKAASFFELLTLWFFLCARHERCGVMAVETGLGGRLDATNILDPLVSVITPIELEHTEYLGTTIAAIAAEKAGIIKPARPLALAEQPGEALEVFREHAARNRSPLFYFPDCAEVHNVRLSREGTAFTLVLKKPEPRTFPDLFVPVPGEVQAKNAGLAILAARTAFDTITEKHIREALSRFILPARFERISGTPPVVIDGAHTPRSIALCLETFTSLYGHGGILIFGCAAGKDVLSMARLCVRCFSRIIVTRPGTFKESNPEEIYATFVREEGKLTGGPELIFMPKTDEAVDYAINLALKQGLPVLGTGSFYLAGEIRKFHGVKANRPGSAGV